MLRSPAARQVPLRPGAFLIYRWHVRIRNATEKSRKNTEERTYLNRHHHPTTSTSAYGPAQASPIKPPPSGEHLKGLRCDISLASANLGSFVPPCCKAQFPYETIKCPQNPRPTVRCHREAWFIYFVDTHG